MQTLLNYSRTCFRFIKTAPSPYRTAGKKGSKSDTEDDDEKDITSAIRKIEFSVNQNIATRRKLSRHSQDDSPQKSPNSVEESCVNSSSDIDQNNIPDKDIKSKSPNSTTMESEENVFNEHKGEMFSPEEQNREVLNHDSDLPNEGSNAGDSPCFGLTETVEGHKDVIDGAVLATLNMETITKANTTEPEEPREAVIEPFIETVNPCDKQSIDHDEHSFENLKEHTIQPYTELEPAAETAMKNVDVVSNESDMVQSQSDALPKDCEEVSPLGEAPPKEAPPKEANVVPSDAKLPRSDAESPVSDPQVLPSTDQVSPKGPEILPTVTDDSKPSESPSPTPESTCSVSTTPDDLSPKKTLSPTEGKFIVESPKKNTIKTTKDPTKTKPTGTKASDKNGSGSTVDSRPKSAKPSTSRSTDNSTTKNTKKPASTMRSTSATKSAPATKTKMTDSKPSNSASKTKSLPSGKNPTTKTSSGKISPTHVTKPTPKSDPKAASSARTSRPTKSTAFGSTVSSTAPKNPAPKTRPATAPAARISTTQAKKKPVAAKVQSWSSTTRPQSAMPSTKSKDSTEAVGNRPASPTKPLFRKTQTRTVTTTKTTRVGADGEPETKSQMLKTTRTVTEVNGKKTTKTIVKELSPTGRKPLRMTTETTEVGTGAKKPNSAVSEVRTGTRTAKLGAKKPQTKPGAKTAMGKSAKTTTKPTTKVKEVKAEIQGVPKTKTVKELSDALGITKPKESAKTMDKDNKAEQEDNVKIVAEDETPVKTDYFVPAEIDMTPQAGESVKAEQLLPAEKVLQVDLFPDPKEETQQSEGTAPAENFESGLVRVETDEAPEAYEGVQGDKGDIVQNTERQSVQDNGELVSDKMQELENDQVSGNIREECEGIISNGSLLDERLLLDQESADSVEENKEVCGDLSTKNDHEHGAIIADGDTESHEVLQDIPGLKNPPGEISGNSHEMPVTSDVIVHDSSEALNLSDIVDQSMEDDSIDVIVVPESDVSLDESALQSTEAWPAVSVGSDGDNNNAVGETEAKLDPYLIPSNVSMGEPANSTADQVPLDISADEKAEPWYVGDQVTSGEPTGGNSGFQENHAVDNLLD